MERAAGVMRFEHIAPAQVERQWPVIAEILAQAVRQDPRQTLEGLHKRLAAGADHLFAISGPGQCLIVLEVGNDLVCWTKYLAGQIEGGPKARMSIIRQAVAHIEQVAKAAGCTEHRLCGREGWARILTDYQPFDGQQNGLFKELS